MSAGATVTYLSIKDKKNKGAGHFTIRDLTRLGRSSSRE